jgi:hypothetical protein
MMANCRRNLMRNSLQGVIAKFREVCPRIWPPRALPVGTCCKRACQLTSAAQVRFIYYYMTIHIYIYMCT